MDTSIVFTAALTLDRSKLDALEEWMGEVRSEPFSPPPPPISHLLLAATSHMESRVQEFVSDEGKILVENILYASSRDGFSNDMFHKTCDSFSPTVTFVKVRINQACRFKPGVGVGVWWGGGGGVVGGKVKKAQNEGRE